jgi:hypothetical protein
LGWHTRQKRRIEAVLYTPQRLEDQHPTSQIKCLKPRFSPFPTRFLKPKPSRPHTHATPSKPHNKAIRPKNLTFFRPIPSFSNQESPHNERGNINDEELQALKDYAADWLKRTSTELDDAVADGILQEICQ